METKTEESPGEQRGGHRMDYCQQQVMRRGEQFRESIEEAHRQLLHLLDAMPRWGDITASHGIALGERCVAWAVVDAKHRELLGLHKEMHELRRSAFWVATMGRDLPTSWTTADSVELFSDPAAYGLTIEQADELREERRQVFESLARSARTMAGLPVSVADTLATHADIMTQREAL